MNTPDEKRYGLLGRSRSGSGVHWVVTVFVAVTTLTPGCRKLGETSDAQTDSTAQPTRERAWFTEITREVGLDFQHESGARDTRRMPEVMASGVALFDYDNDGDLDIYLTNGNRALPNLDTPDAEKTCNRLFRQESDGHFVDVTAESGLGDTAYGMGVAIGDIDNDGDADVYLTNLGGDRLFRNRGDGTFEDITESANLTGKGWSASACFFDYDADGFLDIYITHYVKWEPGKMCYESDGRPTYCGPLSFVAERDVLLHNDAGVTFTDVSEQAGIRSIRAAGLGVVCQDFNDDGRHDVYVTNDAYANQLWINQGDGTFVDEALGRGTAFNFNGEREAGMGIIAADFDNDGNNDLFMTHLIQETNTMYRSLGGDRGFVDVTNEVGLGWSSISYTGFGTAAFDVELDGDLDLYIVNGRVRRSTTEPVAGVPPPWNELVEPNLFYLNTGAGRFEQLLEPVATLCEPLEVSRGLAVGDLDGDGDIDLVQTNIQGAARLYRNDAPKKGAWLMVRAVDPRYHRDAIGAEVTVAAGDRRFMRTIGRAYSYLSSSDVRAHFGLGAVANVERIEVDWKDGLRETFSPPPLNTNVELIRGTGKEL